MRDRFCCHWCSRVIIEVDSVALWFHFATKAEVNDAIATHVRWRHPLRSRLDRRMRRALRLHASAA